VWLRTDRTLSRRRRNLRAPLRKFGTPDHSANPNEPTKRSDAFSVTLWLAMGWRPRPLSIGRIFVPLLLLACSGGRTGLTDATAAVSASDADDQTSSDWDGGLLDSTPGQVRCGPITCAHGDQCCLRAEGSPASIGCDSRARSTCLGTGYWRTCDETADCLPGEFCGWEWVTTVTLMTACVPMFDGPMGHVMCGSDDDCRALGVPPCIAQRCRGDVLQTCGLIPSEYCPP
jgi:hypothetical protein